MNEPRVLTDSELIAFEQSDKCRWWGKSLLLTLAWHREEAKAQEELLRARIGLLQTSLDWFESTYHTKALRPMFAPKAQGERCPHCKQNGACHVGRFWLCVDCGQQWKEP